MTYEENRQTIEPNAKTHKHGNTYGKYAREHAHEQSHTLKKGAEET